GVPEFVTPPPGRREDFASPSARNPAVRSSIRLCRVSSPAAAASYRAKESGALREPGASTAWRTPDRRSASTTARASAVLDTGEVTVADPPTRSRQDGGASSR